MLPGFALAFAAVFVVGSGLAQDGVAQTGDLEDGHGANMEWTAGPVKRSRKKTCPG